MIPKSSQNRFNIKALRGVYRNRAGERIRYDSQTELASMMMLDRIGRTWIKNTALRIPYTDATGRTRKYIPDFIVYSDLGSPTSIIEIKGADRPELIHKFSAAEAYCKKNKMKFLVVWWEQVFAWIDIQEVRNYHLQIGSKMPISVAEPTQLHLF